MNLSRLALILLAFAAVPSPCPAGVPDRLRSLDEPRDGMPWAIGGHLTWWHTKDAGDGLGAGPTMRRNLGTKFAGEGNITLYPQMEEEQNNVTFTSEIIAVTATALFLIPVRNTDMDDQWQPYIGAGVGYYKVDMDVEDLPGASIDVDNEIGFHVVAGMDIWATDRIDIPIQIRYAVLEIEPTLRTPAGTVTEAINLDGVSVWVGANYRF